MQTNALRNCIIDALQDLNLPAGDVELKQLYGDLKLMKCGVLLNTSSLLQKQTGGEGMCWSFKMVNVFIAAWKYTPESVTEIYQNLWLVVFDFIQNLN